MNFERIEFEEVYQIIDKDVLQEYSYGFIGRMQKNNVFRILFVIEEDKVESDKEQKDYNNKNRIAQEIIAKDAIATYNTTVNSRFIIGY